MRPWEYDEDVILVDAIERLGKRWKDIAALFPARTDAMCRNRWARMQAPSRTESKRWRAPRNKCNVCGAIKKGHSCAQKAALAINAGDEAPAASDHRSAMWPPPASDLGSAVGPSPAKSDLGSAVWPAPAKSNLGSTVRLLSDLGSAVWALPAKSDLGSAVWPAPAKSDPGSSVEVDRAGRPPPKADARAPCTPGTIPAEQPKMDQGTITPDMERAGLQLLIHIAGGKPFEMTPAA